MGKRWLVIVAAVSLAFAASSPREPAPASPSNTVAPTGTPGLEPSFVPTAAPPPPPGPGIVQGPAPNVGGPCPVEAALCDTAFDILARAYAYDTGGMLAATTPRTLRCPAPGEPFPILVFNTGDVCDGAAPGDVRPYFVASGQSGEGQAQSPARFEESLREHLERLPQTPGGHRDAYGAASLVIAGIACFRTAGPSGTCTGEFAEVALTAIRNDGARIVECFGVHRPADETRWLLDSVGCAPLFLYAFSTPARASETTTGTFENYPWTPLARHPLPPNALAALRANLPVPAPLDGECQVSPQSAPVALCYTDVKQAATSLEVAIGYPGTSGGWRVKISQLPDGSYRIDSVTRQGI